MNQKIVVKNPSGIVVYSTTTITDAERFIRNHEMNGLKGFTIDFINN